MTTPLVVLVVEDDALQARLLQRLIERAGHRVLACARDVSEALEWALHPDLDGALLDVNLGGEESTPVADVLTERGLPFLVITGYRCPALVGKSLLAARRLTKPIEPDQLLSEIERFGDARGQCP